MLSKLLILVVSLEWRCTTARSRRSVDDMDLIVDAQSFSRVGSSVGNGISAIPNVATLMWKAFQDR